MRQTDTCAVNVRHAGTPVPSRHALTSAWSPIAAASRICFSLAFFLAAASTCSASSTCQQHQRAPNNGSEHQHVSRSAAKALPMYLTQHSHCLWLPHRVHLPAPLTSARVRRPAALCACSSAIRSRSRPSSSSPSTKPSWLLGGWYLCAGRSTAGSASQVAAAADTCSVCTTLQPPPTPRQ